MRNEDSKCDLVDSGLATALVAELKALAEDSEACIDPSPYTLTP